MKENAVNPRIVYYGKDGSATNTLPTEPIAEGEVVTRHHPDAVYRKLNMHRKSIIELRSRKKSISGRDAENPVALAEHCASVQRLGDLIKWHLEEVRTMSQARHDLPLDITDDVQWNRYIARFEKP